MAFLKILFIVPPSSLKERYGDLLEAGAVYPSMGLAYVAAAAELDGHDVRILDAEATGLSFEDIRAEVKIFQPDVIGMQTFCANLPRCYEIAEIAKSVSREIKIVLGGVQSTLFPEDQLQNNNIDFVVLGEGEVTFRNLVSTLQRKDSVEKVAGIMYRNSSGSVFRTQPRRLIGNIDEIPFPALHLFPMDKYHSSSQVRGNRTLHLITSRGCPFRCSYCSGDLIFGRTFRFRSPQKVVEDLLRMISEFKIDGIQFYDETFTVNRKRVFELCDAMDAAGIKLPWACFTRVDCIDEALLVRMKQSGCYQIFFGVETGVPRLLEMINKGTTLDQARSAFKLTRKIGIETVASFMLTLPTETVEETWQSVRFGIELDPDYVYWLTFVPYPGNELAEIASQTGHIINDDPTTYNVFNEIVYVPEGRSVTEIKQSVAKAYRKFYLRPRYILRQVKKLKQLPPSKARNLIKGGFRTLFKRKVD